MKTGKSVGNRLAGTRIRGIQEQIQIIRDLIMETGKSTGNRS